MQNNFYQKTLPRPLTKEEVYSCLKKIKQGDMEAREKIIIHNLRLVIYIARKYYNTSYDFEELCSVGELGLLKSIDTFDITKNVEFATYATRCINNEILLFMRSGKKYINLDSIDRAIYEDKEGNVLTIMDMLEDLNADFVSASETESIHQEIRQIIDELPPREKKLIMLNFGFINDKVYTQEEIAEMLHISQSYVSRIIKKTLKNLAVKLEQAGIIEKSDWGQKIRGVPKEKVASSTKKVVSENEISKKVAEDILKKKLELEPFFAKNQKNILVKEQALKENQVVDLPQESLVVKEEKK